jgi:tetratricopeptide (TPR) repeat protein
VTARYNLGVVYGKLNKIEDAISAYKIVVEKQPKHWKSLLNMGYAYLKTGQKEQAMKCFQSVVAIMPDSAEAKGELEKLKTQN